MLQLARHFNVLYLSLEYFHTNCVLTCWTRISPSRIGKHRNNIMIFGIGKRKVITVCPTLHFTPICNFFTHYPFSHNSSIPLPLHLFCANGQMFGTLTNHGRPLHWLGESTMEHIEPKMGKKCWSSESSRMEHLESKIEKRGCWRQLEELLRELEDKCWTKQH